ncbi:hypothetical protein GCM10022281_12040 [Sphingomonas rosea]|uniref:Uncharacterized protein n=1 Tax=Sphingomonas rosea TaxID=335605 RepID=A0ABP7TZP5_9SPHN
MSNRVFLFALWCLAMLTASVAASYYAWSPFADGSRRSSSGFYGPTHK